MSRVDFWIAVVFAAFLWVWFAAAAVVVLLGPDDSEGPHIILLLTAAHFWTDKAKREAA